MALKNYVFGLLILMIPMFFSGCGTFKLSGGIYPPAGKNSDQQQTDYLTCKDQALMEANTAGRQTGSFLLGMTIIGVPLAYELEKAKQREVFAECMRARGYTVLPIDDKQGSAVSSQQTGNVVSSRQTMNQPPAYAAPPPTAIQPASRVSISLPVGWTQLPILPHWGRTTEAILYATNRTIDADLFLWATKCEGITDFASFANTRRAIQINRLDDPQPSELIPIDVNGKKCRISESLSLKGGYFFRFD